MTRLTQWTLSEQFAFGDAFTWRLKDSQIRYRGKGRYSQSHNECIPVETEAVSEFAAALDLLDVWSWRDDYHPSDLGYTVCDGSSWSFTAAMGDRECRCGGVNAYPAFQSPSETTLRGGRYALLVEAMYQSFGINDAFVDEMY